MIKSVGEPYVRRNVVAYYWELYGVCVGGRGGGRFPYHCFLVLIILVFLIFYDKISYGSCITVSDLNIDLSFYYFVLTKDGYITLC